MSQTLALFDFDGTLTQKDSLFEFIKFSVGVKRYYIGMVFFSPIFIIYRLKIISNDTAKLKLLNLFFKNNQKLWEEKTAKFHLYIPSILKKEAVKKLLWHKEQHHRVIVVSASAESWLKKWCQSQNIELIATQFTFKNKKLIYQLPNCNYEEKAKRIKSYLELKSYDEVYAYGDSRGDKYMFSLATKSFYKTFF